MQSIKSYLKGKGLLQLRHIRGLSISERDAMEQEVGAETAFALRAIFIAADEAQENHRSSEEVYALILRNSETAELSSELEEAVAVSIPFNSLIVHPAAHSATLPLDEDDAKYNLIELIQARRASIEDWRTLVGSSIDFSTERVELSFTDGPSAELFHIISQDISAHIAPLRFFDFVAYTEADTKELGRISIMHELYRPDTVLGLKTGATLFSSSLNREGRTSTGTGTTTCVVEVLAGNHTVTGVITAAHCASRCAVAVTQYAPCIREVHCARENIDIPVLGAAGKDSKNGGTAWSVDIAFLPASALPSPNPNTFQEVPFFGYEADQPVTLVRSGTIEAFCPLTIGATVREYKAKEVFVMGQQRACVGELVRSYTDFSANSEVYVCIFPSVVDSGDSGAPVMVATKTEGRFLLIGVLSKKVTSRARNPLLPTHRATDAALMREKGAAEPQESLDREWRGEEATAQKQEAGEKAVFGGMATAQKQDEGETAAAFGGMATAQKQDAGETAAAFGGMGSKQRVNTGEYIVAPVQYLGVNVKLFGRK